MLVNAWPGCIVLLPSKETDMRAEGSKVESRSGTRPALVKWAWMASISRAVLELWAMARVATERRRNDLNIVVDGR